MALPCDPRFRFVSLDADCIIRRPWPPGCYGRLASMVLHRFVLSVIAVVIAICVNSRTAVAQESGSAAPPANIYAATGQNALAPAAAQARPLVYVPNSRSATVTVIDPATYRVLRTFPTGALPQHVVPSYDLGTLWVVNNDGNSVTPIDPVTGEEGLRIPVEDPYNLYFTPDGRFALVIAERLDRIDFREPHDMRLVQSLRLACKGV